MYTGTCIYIYICIYIYKRIYIYMDIHKCTGPAYWHSTSARDQKCLLFKDRAYICTCVYEYIYISICM